MEGAPRVTTTSRGLSFVFFPSNQPPVPEPQLNGGRDCGHSILGIRDRALC
ncbi:hypothetical protein GQ607_011277 [Colletotrichum asianum]|uniref:Uncharacterized protein n=1 Tax=Colletotrichum asianum TaxID=702518 RepID=A0A8H3ZMZ8_9PEZI|nr:hypothetical protein GQ607_011277 [Colletotrichum asianum]